MRRPCSGVKCGHDFPTTARHSGMSCLQKAAGTERNGREPEVRRVPPRLSSAGQYSHSAGRRSGGGEWSRALGDEVSPQRGIVSAKHRRSFVSSVLNFQRKCQPVPLFLSVFPCPGFFTIFACFAGGTILKTFKSQSTQRQIR